MEHVKKPDWLKISIKTNERYTQTKQIVDSHRLHTICSSGRCPNLGECWGKGTATFMIGGNICTRSCKFCNTQTGKPLPLDPEEPLHVAESIRLMKLSHAVITSVDRDDLPDFGANHWAETISMIRQLNPKTTIEVLIPDFQGNESLIQMVTALRPDIVAHNMDRYISQSGCTAKSGIMAGLGEQPHEVEELMDDLLDAGCKIITIGQYLQPTHRHYPVAEYVTPQQFAAYKDTALAKGFAQAESAPLVRSSYHAGDYFKPCP